MNDLKLIERYKASNISIPKNMVGWMRSNHAGETGAVWIYLGAKCVFWNRKIQAMSKEHYQTEKNHLFVMNHILGGAGFNSRLMKEIREKRGLTYSVSTSLTQYDNAELYLGMFQSSNEKVSIAIDILKQELLNMAENGEKQEVR